MDDFSKFVSNVGNKPFVVTLDVYDERGIRCVECFVRAASLEDAKERVYHWLQNIYNNEHGTKVREATEEERLSSKYWA